MGKRRHGGGDDDLSTRLHGMIYQTATEAVAAVAHLADPERPEGDIHKRIVRHAYKAASDPELLQMPWDQLCRELVQRAMRGWAPGNCDAPWFYAIKLTPVFCAAAWELLQAAGGAPVSPPEVEEVVNLEYEDKLDRHLLDKAIWEVVKRIFEDEKVQTKFYHALSRSYWPALDEALGPLLMQERLAGGILPPNKELPHLEAFIKRWIDDALCRVWASMQQAGVTLDEETIAELFCALVVPFGEQDPFTCMPCALMEQIGRPPPDWPFIPQVVQELFESWGRREQQQGAAPRKRRRGAGAGAGAGEGREDAEVGEAATPRLPAAAEAKARPLLQPQAKARGNPYLPGQARARSNPYLHGQAGAGAKARAKFRGLVPKAKLEEDDEGQEEFQDGESGTEAAEAEEQDAGHPRCTSEEDCIGTPDSRLVQHLLNGKQGDIYCEACWDSFFQRNPALDGTFVEE